MGRLWVMLASEGAPFSWIRNREGSRSGGESHLGPMMGVWGWGHPRGHWTHRAGTQGLGAMEKLGCSSERQEGKSQWWGLRPGGGNKDERREQARLWCDRGNRCALPSQGVFRAVRGRLTHHRLHSAGV